LGALVILSAGPAVAQTDNRLALGGSFLTSVAGDSRDTTNNSVTFEMRLGHEHEQWGVAASFLGWYTANFDTPSLSPSRRMGGVRVRPLLAGYGYTFVRGRAAITANLLGGFSFNSLHLDDETSADLKRRGATNIDSEATNTFVVKPEAQMWYDMSPRIGVRLSAGYVVARPTLSVISSLGRDEYKVHADTLLISFGVVYSFF
jgi:hypothetical protein